jgi:hypothetical protein
MELPTTPEWHRTKHNMNPRQPSLDRIDSSKGYIEGNVEFVCVSINYAKNGFSKQQMIDFIKEIKLLDKTVYRHL